MEPCWVCINCGWHYRVEDGDPGQGIPSGTPFEDLPEGWRCPVCYVGQDEFDPE